MPSSYNSFAFRAHQKRQKYPVYDIFGYVEKMLYVVLVSRRHGAPCHIDLCSLDRTFQSRFTQRFLMLISTAGDFHLAQCSRTTSESVVCGSQYNASLFSTLRV